MVLKTLRGFILLLFGAQLWAQSSVNRPRNVVLMIPDGFGPASVTMARDFSEVYRGEHTLALDQFLVGTCKTYATNSRVTDSAAGATAYASGVKTFNGAIGVDADGNLVATLLEAAERKGMWTGLVATSRITHATPAAFSAHVPSRASEEDIAAQQIEQNIEVFFGGGAREFLPKSEGGKRSDDRNLLEELRHKGVHVVQNVADFRAQHQIPMAALFSSDHMAYEIDRDGTQPHLAEMATKALALLKDSPNGFFLMIEGSRIDHAAHANDPQTHVRDIMAYDEAVEKVLAFAQSDANTLVISVADHETGGMTLGRDGNYKWFPEVLQQVKASSEQMASWIKKGASIDSVLIQVAGISDVKSTERDAIQAQINSPNEYALANAISALISQRALVGWTTGGHTAVDVNLYAFGPGADALRGNHQNYEVGRVIEQLLGFDLDALTRKMRE